MIEMPAQQGAGFAGGSGSESPLPCLRGAVDAGAGGGTSDGADRMTEMMVQPQE